MIYDGLSFIIPTLNEEEGISGVLDSIKENIDGRFVYEVIVVDNGSCDRTVEIALKMGAICFHAPGYSISSLRNLGALEAKCDILVFLDGDVYLRKEWVLQIGPVMEKLRCQRHIITGSFCGISDENNWIERIWFAPRTERREVTQYMNSGHLIIHRSLFSRVGGFNPDLKTGEDYEFCSRARKRGARVENDPELKVVHAGYPKSIKRFFARERWHGCGDYQSHKTLLSSKPALVSLANLCVAVICSFAMVISKQFWFVFLSIYVLFLAGVSVAASIKRCSDKFNVDFLGNVFLYMVYFTARTIALIDVGIRLFSERRPTHV